MHNTDISIIIPVRNESPQVLRNLESLAQHTDIREIIVADASTRSDSLYALERLENACPEIRVVHSEQSGRAVQMNLGQRHATGSILWFVHADTQIPENAVQIIRDSVSSQRPWGRFDVQFSSSFPIMSMVAWMMNIRSALTAVCTGDQAIFVERETFRRLGGYPNVTLMEDVAFTKLLRGTARPVRVRTPVITSSRRWETNGYIRTILLMWLLRFLYWLGVSPSALARIYRPVR